MSCSAEPDVTQRPYVSAVFVAARRLMFALALIGVGMSGIAYAQEEPAGEDEPQVFDFEEDEISTDYLKPNTMMVEGLRRGRMSSLISVRLHFVDEIVKSAEDI